MCGIFGGYKVKNLDNLAQFNVKRGNLGFGGLSISRGQEIIFRYSMPYHKELSIPAGDLIFCHTLASTGDAKRIHPFETDRFVLAHNGILLDYKFQDWYIGPVDSQYLLGGIQYKVNEGMSVIRAIKGTNEQLKGQRACWLWDKFEKIAYFWRVMSPLFYVEKPFTFSSAEFEDSKMLEEGTVYSFDYRNDLFSKCETFKFYSAYLV